MTAAQPASVLRRPERARPRRIRLQYSRGWAALNLRELWAFRDLLIMLAARDVTLRYRQTALGVTWVVLQPLSASIIFTVIFGRLAKLPSDGLPYLLFAYAGLMAWNLFAGSLQRGGTSLVEQSNLITKVYFPRMVLPIASVGAVLVDFAVALGVMLVLMLAYRVAPTPKLLALPALVALVLVIASGVSLALSALTVYYRDFVHVLPFAVQLWLYASPVVYSTSLVPEHWLPFYALNPMVGAIEGFRWALLGRGEFPLVPLALSVVVGCAVFVGGALLFRRVERSFADVV